MRARKFVRSCALFTVTALAAALVHVPPAAAAGGPSVPLPQVPSVPVTSPGHTGPPAGDQTSPGLRNDQGPRAIDPGSGDYTATSLKPSATWDVAEHTGDFSWSYPLRVPPAPGGLEPDLALSYSSSAVDGLTSSTNNQASWIGDGWSMWPGSVEREYRSCTDDITTGEEDDRPADLCWRSDNATLSLNGTTPLIRIGTSNVWRPKDDDGSRVELITTAGNGDLDGESWRVTTVDGTQYYFGTVPAAESTWTVPVFGDDAGEPCNVPGSFATSSCAQAWRWNLDKIVDRNGNMVLFTYKKEQNHYGRNKNSAATAYDRGGWLHQVRYGLRADDGSVPATGVVDFETVDRCVPGSDCTWSKPDNLPDVPLNLKCDGGSCPDKWSPTFWTTKQLRTVTTRVLRDGQYQPVDSWTLRHELPDPGDGEKPALWLKGVTHTGHAGGTIALPEVTFDGSRFVNRVAGTDGYASLIRFRMNAIVSETGGVVSIRYAEPECKHGITMPANAESNSLRCFPSRWKPKGAEPRTDYFHKYVVASVSEMDGIAGTIAHVTAYEYLDGAAWHWPTGDSGEEDEKTYNEFRGFGKVRTRVGSGHDGLRTMTEQRFYRGMHGDRLPGNGSRTVKVKDSEGLERVDSDWLRGFEFETATFEHEEASPGEPRRLTKTITDPYVSGPTANNGLLQAYIVRTGVTTGYTLPGTGRRTTRSTTDYNGYGLPKKVTDEGDLDKPADDRCIRTTYAENTTKWLLDRPAHIETVAVLCDQTPVFPRDALSDEKLSYDDFGNVTKTEIAESRPAADPVYVTRSTTEYDVHGRVTKATDPLGNATKTAYIPAVGGPTTKTVVTAPPAHSDVDGLVTTTTVDVYSGQPVKVEDPNERVTETTYDALGRRTEIWLPNRPRGDHPRGNAQFAYAIDKSGPIAVTTKWIGANGVFTDSTELYDGLLRPRQKQTPAPGGGRLLSDTRYDSHGRASKTTQPYFNDAPVGTGLVFPTDADVPAITRTEYDGAGRPIAEVFQGKGFEWRTTTTYGGDRVHVTPRQGGTPTTTIVDAQGRTTELRQFHDSGANDYYATKYEYTKAGQLAKVVDQAGNTWLASYDLRGRMTTSDDPDQGVITMTYDNADRVETTTDARDVTLAYSYDGLGRKTGTYRDRVGGTKLAEWTYDTANKGKGYIATTTRFAGGHEYKTSIGNYSQLYQPTEKSVTIPATDPALNTLAGTYTWFGSYGWDGSLSGEVYPEAGGLEAETVDYVLDNLGRPVSSTGAYDGDTIDLVSSVDYTRYGEMERLQLGSGTKRTWISRYYEESTHRLSRTIVDAEVPAPMQTDVNYMYDPEGNITSITDRPSGRTPDTQCFRYDGLGRLTNAWTPAAACASPSASLGGPAPYRNSYTHDAVGNRLTSTQGSTTSTYTYPSAHKVSSVTTGTNTVDYTYDDAGNTIARTGEQFEWDLESSLASVTKAGAKTSFVYTADGERLLKRDPSGITLYLANQEIRLAAGSSVATATRYYKLGKETVAVRQGAALTWLATDHQGTPQVAVNFKTLQVSQRRQDPFGVPRGTAPAAWPGEKSFVGGEQDASTGLTHLGARDYDPKLGRFLSVDSVMDLSAPQQMQGYAYSDNNPVTYQDATGMLRSPDGGYSSPEPSQTEPYKEKNKNKSKDKGKGKGKDKGKGKSKSPDGSVFSTPKTLNDILSAMWEGVKRSDGLEADIALLKNLGAFNEFVWANPWFSKVLNILDNKLVRAVGRFSAILSPALSYADYRATGDRPVSAAMKAGIETFFSWGGAAIGGGVGGLMGVPYASIGMTVGAVVGTIGGAYVGNWLGGLVAKAADPFIDSVGNSIEDGFNKGPSQKLFDIGIRVNHTADTNARDIVKDGHVSGGEITDSAIDIGLSVFGW